MNAWPRRHEIQVPARESLARQTRRRAVQAWQEASRTSQEALSIPIIHLQ
jgi:hypothetical protein